MRRLLPLIAAAMFLYPASAGAVQITKHGHYRDPLTHVMHTYAYTVDVAPPDSDDDGYADDNDNCPHDSYTGNGGCTPEPAPVVTYTESSSDASYSGASSSTLEAIAACESGGDPTAISPDGAYRGKYQFDYGTWASVGGSGDPAAASEAEQDQRAADLYAQSGAAPWPVCGQ